MAGTLQPNPIISGIKDLPCSPIRCIILSMINAARAIYPESSNIEIKKYNMRIFGRKTITPPTPPIIPSISKSFKGPSAILFRIRLPNWSTLHRIVTQNKGSLKHDIKKQEKIGYPQMRCVTILSITRVVCSFSK